MALVGKKGKNVLEDILRTGLGTALVGVGSGVGGPGLFGAIGSIGAGYVSKQWLVKGTMGDIVFGFSVINAVDLLMESFSERGVIG